MNCQKFWREQCKATRAIREHFGIKSALDYLMGEKLLDFVLETNRNREFAAELPWFQVPVWSLFNLYEFAGYLAGLKPSTRRTLRKLLYVPS